MVRDALVGALDVSVSDGTLEPDVGGKMVKAIQFNVILLRNIFIFFFFFFFFFFFKVFFKVFQVSITFKNEFL